MSDRQLTAQERIQKKREAKRAQARKQMASGKNAMRIGIVFALLALFYLAVGSSTVKSIEFSGAEHIPADQLQKAVTGVKGVKMYKVPVNDIRSKIMANGWAEQVRVNRRYIGRSILIEITERKAFINVGVGNTFAIVDQNGNVVETSKYSMLELPLIMDLGVKKLKPRDHIDIRAFDTVVEILGKMPSKLRKDVGVISVKDTSNITMLLKSDNTEILFGDDTEIEKKIRAITGVLDKKEGSVIGIDVRVPDKPATKTAPAETAPQ